MKRWSVGERTSGGTVTVLEASGPRASASLPRVQCRQILLYLCVQGVDTSDADVTNTAASVGLIAGYWQ